MRPLPSAKTTEASAREVVAEASENCFGKPDGPAPSAKITERARTTARVCHGCRGSFGRRLESCFGKPNGPAPSAKITEASASDAPLRGCRGSFGRRPESLLGKPDGPDPSVKTTGTSFRAARRARPKPKPSMILRVAKNATRRARAGFLRTLNPKRFWMWVVKGWGCRFRRAPPRPQGRGRASSWKP